MSTWTSSGVAGFDEVVQGLRTGDNVVWQVDTIEGYRDFVRPFVAQAARDGRKVVYLRFGRHEALVPPTAAEVFTLEAASGFESFSRQVHTIATRQGRGTSYVFDCLSDLLFSWATDLMIGNFFRVTCPYLRDLDTIAYFAVQRNRHSHKTIARIRETTQLLVDVHDFEGRCYAHPIKALGRYSPTMFLPHVRRDDQMTPVTSSVEASRLFAHIGRTAADAPGRPPDRWDYLLAEAREALAQGHPKERRQGIVAALCRETMAADPDLTAIIQRFFTLDDLLEVRSRIVGTGFIGGKAVGMLLARNILLRDTSADWAAHLEPHDSYYVGSDVFYTYIVENGWWPLWMEQKTEQGYFGIGKVLKEELLTGHFPEEIRESFRRIIDWFGQSPIIVRSSSLQEDGFGNAFAGKYQSVFLANQGHPDERFTKFLTAVRTVYSSTMSDDALIYRKQRGLDQRDEQMALLVQRVSGEQQGRYFLPFCAGVGISYNMFVWTKEIAPEDGMLRLVFGLGTRAVNRVEGDYPRLVALGAPTRQPLAGLNDVRRFTQHTVDVIDTAEDAVRSLPVVEVTRQAEGMPLELVGGPAPDEPRVWLLTFEQLLTGTDFVPLMKRMLGSLAGTYGRPVEIEFTLNFENAGTARINLVQCRPIQARGVGRPLPMPRHLERGDTIFSARGNFIGGNRVQPIRRIIYVDPRQYAALNLSDKYQVARVVGRLNRLTPGGDLLPVMLLGPGRWGTTTPSLGIPVSFHEINRVSVLCELEFPEGDLTPEPSFGTHFFHDLVETGIFYVALFARSEGTFFNGPWFSSLENRLADLLPSEKRLAHAVKIHDPEGDLLLLSDLLSQRIVCCSGPTVTNVP